MRSLLLTLAVAIGLSTPASAGSQTDAIIGGAIIGAGIGILLHQDRYNDYRYYNAPPRHYYQYHYVPPPPVYYPAPVYRHRNYQTPRYDNRYNGRNDRHHPRPRDHHRR